MEKVFILLIATGFILIGLNVRYHKIIEAKKTWTYYCYRYENYCLLHDLYYDETLRHHNQITAADILCVLIMFWKLNPDKYFSYKPSFDEIYKLYLKNNL